MTNWRAVGIGFLVELAVGFVGLLVPGIGQLVAGLVGGFVAGYIGTTTIRGGLWHGLLAGSLGGFLLAIPLGMLVAVASTGIGLTTHVWGLVAGIGTALFVPLVAVVLGANSAIGGAIGGLLQNESASPRTRHPETVTHRKYIHSSTTGTENGRAVSNHKESSGSKLTDVVRKRR